MINHCIIIAICAIGSACFIMKNLEFASEEGSRAVETERLFFAQQRFYSNQTDPIVGCDYLDAAFEYGSHHRMAANQKIHPELFEIAVSKHLASFLNYYAVTSVGSSNSTGTLLYHPGGGCRLLNHRDIPGVHPIGGNGAEIIRVMMGVLLSRTKHESTYPKLIGSSNTVGGTSQSSK
jgi:hypothetical protein